MFSVVTVACCQVEIFAKGGSRVQRRPTEYVCVHVLTLTPALVRYKSQTKQWFSRMSSGHAIM
jgi:hypothetical protein